MSERLVPLGEIVATHGIEGWLKLKPYNPETASLFSAQSLFLERGGTRTLVILETARPHKGLILVKLREIEGINAAKKWVGFVLCVAEDALQPLDPGEYYYYQVIGFDVLNLQGEWIGVVTRIWSKPGGDLYVVTQGSKEYLIPAVKEMIEKVDLEAGKLIINPPAGLLEL